MEDIPPEYDVETQHLASDGYEILENKAIKKYRIEDIPEREEPIEVAPIPTLEEQLQALEVMELERILGGGFE